MAAGPVGQGIGADCLGGKSLDTVRRLPRPIRRSAFTGLLRAGQIDVSTPDGAPAAVRWDDLASKPGWCKLDWVVADPTRHQLANASTLEARLNTFLTTSSTVRSSKFFGSPGDQQGLRRPHIADPDDIRRLTAYFSWVAWVSAANFRASSTVKAPSTRTLRKSPLSDTAIE